jgi:hypothetical protein
MPKFDANAKKLKARAWLDLSENSAKSCQLCQSGFLAGRARFSDRPDDHGIATEEASDRPSENHLPYLAGQTEQSRRHTCTQQGDNKHRLPAEPIRGPAPGDDWQAPRVSIPPYPYEQKKWHVRKTIWVNEKQLSMRPT